MSQSFIIDFSHRLDHFRLKISFKSDATFFSFLFFYLSSTETTKSLPSWSRSFVSEPPTAQTENLFLDNILFVFLNIHCHLFLSFSLSLSLSLFSLSLIRSLSLSCSSLYTQNCFINFACETRFWGERERESVWESERERDWEWEVCGALMRGFPIKQKVCHFIAQCNQLLWTKMVQLFVVW